jgi:hypothetical protein
MPVKLSALRNNAKHVKIRFADVGDLNVTFYPHRFTQEVVDRFQDAVEGKDYDLASEAFRDVVEEWDITDDDDVPLPMDAETFQTIGLPALNAIWDEIRESATPKSRKRSGRS